MESFGESMCRLITLVLCCLLASPQAQACWGTGSALFFKAESDIRPDGDVVAMVSVLDISGTLTTGSGTATVMVTQVIRASDPRIHQGDKVTMKYGFDSCGPNTYRDAKGVVVAKTGTDSDGRPVLYPYSYDHKGKITPPFGKIPYIQTLSPKPERLAQLNASCAAFYDVLTNKDLRQAKVKEDFLVKLNFHSLYAKRLYASAESYETAFSKEKFEIKKAQSERNLGFQAWVEKCVSVEFHTPLVVKEHKLIPNQ